MSVVAFSLAELAAEAKKGHAACWAANPELLGAFSRLLSNKSGSSGPLLVPVGEKEAVLFMTPTLCRGAASRL